MKVEAWLSMEPGLTQQPYRSRSPSRYMLTFMQPAMRSAAQGEGSKEQGRVKSAGRVYPAPPSPFPLAGRAACQPLAACWQASCQCHVRGDCTFILVM